MGFEPTRAEHIGLAVQRLNHSATSSVVDLQNNGVRSCGVLRQWQGHDSYCTVWSYMMKSGYDFCITWVGLGRALNFACRDKLYSSLGVSEITQIKKTNPEFKTLSERRLSLEVYFYRNLRDHI